MYEKTNRNWQAIGAHSIRLIMTRFPAKTVKPVHDFKNVAGVMLLFVSHIRRGGGPEN